MTGASSAPAAAPVDRYLVRKDTGVNTLAALALQVLVGCIVQVPRMATTSARSWVQRHVPVSVRESILAAVTCNLEAAASASASAANDDAVAALRRAVSKSWALLYSDRLQTIRLPPELESTIRDTVLSYLAGRMSSGGTATLRLSVVGPLKSGEKEALMAHLAHSSVLTVLCLRKAADNAILQLVGKCCPLLQELNITGSSAVTDVGVALFLGVEPSQGFSTPPSSPSLNAVRHSLRYAKMRACGVRVHGVRLLLTYATNLQGIRCSSHDVLQALALHLKDASSPSALPLRYMDFSNCFPIVAKYVCRMPHLAEVRIGSDAPPYMRDSHHRLRASDAANAANGDVVAAACAELHKLAHLQALVLKDFGSMKSLTSVLTTGVGSGLRRLDIHYMSSEPGLDLRVVARLCPFLADLTVCDSLVDWSEDYGLASSAGSLSCLETCRLLRVTYKSAEVWEAVPRRAARLRLLHLEAAASMTDGALMAIMAEGALAGLEELVVVGRGHQLSARSVFRLASNCTSLRSIADLRDWNMSDSDRRVLVLKLPEWRGMRTEPKASAADQHSTHKIYLDTRRIVDFLL